MNTSSTAEHYPPHLSKNSFTTQSPEDKIIISSRFLKSGLDNHTTPSTIYIWGNFTHKSDDEGPIIIKELFNFNIKSVTIGHTHILFLTHTGQIFSYGEGLDGQLGLGPNYTHTHTPRLIIIPNIIKEIACGSSHSIALTNDGMVYIWGSGEVIGEEWPITQFTPILMSYFAHYQIVCKTIFAYDLTSLFGTVNGDIYLLGNYFSQNFYRTPTHLFKLDEEDHVIHQLAIGHMFGVILTVEGTVYLWGDGTYGELPSINRTLFSIHHRSWTNTPYKLPLYGISGDPLPHIINISVGYRHALLLGENGRIYSFGSNQCGQCGSPQIERNFSMPMPIHYSGPIPYAIRVMCGKYHSACLTNNGHLYTWGHSGGNKLISNYSIDTHLSQSSKPGIAHRSGIHSCVSKATLIYSLINECVCVASLGDDCTVVVIGEGAISSA